MTKPPNILLITSDQQHFDTLGVNNSRIKTPSLNKLCQEGTRFDRAYCPSPVCTPSRSSIVTGMYPSQHGAWTIGVKLPEDVPTIGEKLAAADYKTSLIGKAHFQPLASVPGSESLERQPTLRDLDFWRKFNGPWYGFDHIELARNHADESHVGQHYAIWLEEQGLTDWRDYFQPLPEETSSKAPKINENVGYWAREERAWRLPEALHYTPWTAERSIAQIDEAVREDRPFFTWASFHDPHPPYTVPEPWASMYNPEDMKPGELVPDEHDKNAWHFGETQKENPDFRGWNQPFQAHGCSSHLYPLDELKKDMAVYYGMISFMDAQIGRILDKLEALGVAENTLVIFSTDHGHFVGQHGLIAKGPFHYEDMLKLPFIVRWPDQIPAGKVSSALQSLIDLTPTFLAAAGQEIPGEIQGVNQLNVWRGVTDAARDHIFCENRHNPVMPHLRTFVTNRHKLTVYRQGNEGELFDLKADPRELNNLWNSPEHGALKLELMHRFIQTTLENEPTRMPRIAGA